MNQLLKPATALAKSNSARFLNEIISYRHARDALLAEEIDLREQTGFEDAATRNSHREGWTEAFDALADAMAQSGGITNVESMRRNNA